ncbi:uncharacterized protein LOC111785029 [Cucurbita pepo subsp. pepo]|uniref:uncharacterized protein LOC111785029 n=1 Tax=Cucurbita pepo subsp. pepo TaxID=3664 RepID=UPI000C9D32C6|nr:uncharacterized protein LOC111785029 [Cucurbita pepo subsp. pepo]
MTDLRLLTYYLGIKVDQRKDCIMLKKSAYAEKVLTDCNPTKYLMDAKLRLEKNAKGGLVNSTVYSCVIESLRFLTHTCLNLLSTVGMMSRYMKKPTMMYHQKTKYIPLYVKETTSYELKYQRGRCSEELVGFTDSNVIGNIDDKKSTIGMTFYFNINLISRQSQK